MSAESKNCQARSDITKEEEDGIRFMRWWVQHEFGRATHYKLFKEESKDEADRNRSNLC